MTTQVAEVREWARERGFDVGNKGRLAPAIWSAYAEAHPGFQRAEPSDVRGSCVCGRKWAGLREAHCTLCHRQFSTVRNFDAHRINRGPVTECVDPLTIPGRDGKRRMRIRESAWGDVYVLDSEYWAVTTYEYEGKE